MPYLLGNSRKYSLTIAWDSHQANKPPPGFRDRGVTGNLETKQLNFQYIANHTKSTELMQSAPTALRLVHFNYNQQF